MKLVITKNLLLQSRAPANRTDTDYFQSAKQRLKALLELTQKSGSRTLVVYGDFIQRITTNQAFELFGLISGSPVTIVWVTPTLIAPAVSQSGLCINLPIGCQHDIGLCTVSHNEGSMGIQWQDGGYSLLLDALPSALALSADTAPGALLFECEKKGRAKHPRVQISELDIEDDRAFVQQSHSDAPLPSHRASTTEFVDKLIGHIATRKASAKALDLRPILMERASALDCDSGVGDYMMKLAEQANTVTTNNEPH